MASYHYSGPVQHLSIATGTIKDETGEQRSVFTDVALIPGGDPIELPDDNPVVVNLIDLGLLQIAEPKTTAKTAKGDKT